ncbi:nascent polypeptide-associated complex subunit alpha, muscle-specific form-like [Parus major]|uniref:nascent polypeptide-associated complex subunit alpha, muscle-specific form-like n=1 Tax=Parus major TaxID=9157 RepID=UPI00077151D6|nr:nascent polypeptide-associated complex subunit alpha, muscle-specific form-like [Parus major]
MERPRLPLPRARPPLPRLLAAAVLVECCARLCPALGSGTGSALSAADPCAHLGPAAGERCRTDRPQRGAGTGQAPTPEAVGQLWTEAELLPFPGTPAGTAESSRPQESPRTPGLGREGTGPAVRGGTIPQPRGPTVSAGGELPSPAALGVTSAAPGETETGPETVNPPGTDPAGHGTAEGATIAQGTLSHSPPSVTVPGSARGQWRSSSTLRGWRAIGTDLVQSQNDILQLGDSSPGTRPSTVLATASSAPGTTGTSPFAGGLQRLLTPTGTLQWTHWGLPGLSGGQGFASHTQEGPRSAPRPSALSLGPGGGPLASTARSAVGTGPALLPATHRGSGLPLPTTMASTPGVTSPGQRGDLELTTGVLGPPDREVPPEHSHIPLSPSAIPGQLPVPLSPGSTAVAQVTHASPGSSHIPPSPQPVPGSGSAVTLLPSPGTAWGALGFSPAVDTTLGDPSPELSHSSSRVGPAESSPSLGGTQLGVGSLAPASAAGPSQQPALSQPASSQPASSLGLTTATGVTTTTGVTATVTTASSPEVLGDMGTVTAELHTAVLQRDVVGLTRGSPTHVPTVVPGPPQQPTESHGGGPVSPPAAVVTDLAQPSSSPGGMTDTHTPQVTLAGVGRASQVFIVEDQPPLLRESLLRIPCELVLDMGFVPALQDPGSHERQELLNSFNRTVTPLFTSVPGFLRLEVTGIREGSVVLRYDALFAAEQLPLPGLDRLLGAALGSAGARPGLAVGTAPVLRHEALARPLDPCALLLACPAGFACVARADGNATCTSLCHRDYCKNHGICSHGRDQQPRCRCPVGSDFWFVGLRCDYRVTQQGLLGTAAGVLLSILLLGAVLAVLAVRRFKALLLEARAEQSRSSYRRFCRLDDVSAQYWSGSGLPSASSLDNPAFSNSEELLQLRVLDSGCQGDSAVTNGAKRGPAPCAHPQCQPSFHYDWDTSSSSMNDPMVDSGKASDISVSSWPMEPIQWAPFPLLHQLSRQRPRKARWPQSFCEGLELGTLERSWTA